MFFVTLVPKQHAIQLRSSSSKTWRSISLTCGTTGILEVGSKHVFADEGTARLKYENRISVDFLLKICRSSALSEKERALCRADAAIGQLVFAGETSRSLVASVFLDDEAFERIDQHLSGNNGIALLTIAVASSFWAPNDGGQGNELEYGGKGNRVVWNINEEQGLFNKLSIESLDITFDDVHRDTGAERESDKLPAFQTTIACELKAIRMAVYVIALAVALVLIRTWQ